MEENNWNATRCSGNRPKRGDNCRSGSGGSPRNRNSRVDPSNITSSQTYFDDVTLNAMIASGMMESLGPINFTQFRVPSLRPYTNNETPSPAIDCNLSWIQKNINLSSFTNQNQLQEGTPSKCKPNSISPLSIEEDEEPPRSDPRLLLPTLIMAEAAATSEGKAISEERKETVMEWSIPLNIFFEVEKLKSQLEAKDRFDRSVEKELKKRKETPPGGPMSFANMIAPPPKDLALSKGLLDRMSEASASRIEIASQMRMQPDTELTDAVDKLAKAEAMCAFAGAVKAAEAAAEAAPPGQAEEAAVASARGFQTEIHTSEIREEIPGVKPMEVIGYIGVTKPKHPAKPQK